MASGGDSQLGGLCSSHMGSDRGKQGEEEPKGIL